MRLSLAIFLELMLLAAAQAQVCRISAAGLNRNRQVFGPVNTECPGGLHSAPFGNWGVASNFGPLVNGHQFDGWCHNSPVVFNSGEARTLCDSEHYQWNSCTDDPNFSAPNCTLYNDADCSAQTTATGVNVMGTIEAARPVGCPVDADGDGAADFGGCADVEGYSHGVNFMSLYELDPLTGDSLVQTLIFPPTPVPLACDVQGCEPNGSSWVSPIQYDDPTDRVIASAEFAMAVNGALFDSQGRCPAAPLPPVSAVSAASYQGDVLARGSIAALFGVDLAPRSQIAVALPLPTALAGVRVEIGDPSGAERSAALLFVSERQINLVIPNEATLGPARIRVVNDRGTTLASGRALIGRVAPGLFTADASGSGPAAALLVRKAPDGLRTATPTFECDDRDCRDRPLRLADGDALELFGVGIRGELDAKRVTVAFGGRPGAVLYAGPQNQFEGLDQINVQPPPGLRGAVDVEIDVAGVRSNRATLLFE